MSKVPTAQSNPKKQPAKIISYLQFIFLASYFRALAIKLCISIANTYPV
ncbi:hypothetical protein [Campylobacter jejuni]|nr:hypothetical protein [Campylobacter jejuni]